MPRNIGTVLIIFGALLSVLSASLVVIIAFSTPVVLCKALGFAELYNSIVNDQTFVMIFFTAWITMVISSIATTQLYPVVVASGLSMFMLSDELRAFVERISR